MGHARWNNNRGIVRPAVVVAVDKKTHRPPRQTGARFAQDHFGTPLDEKHHVPLLVFVGAEGKILRFIDEKAPEPFVRRGAVRHTWWMNVKTLRRLGEHPGGRPLLRPEPDPCQRPFIATCKFAEQSAMPLRMNGARKNFDPRDPGLAPLPGSAPVCARELAGLDSDLRDALRPSERAP